MTLFSGSFSQRIFISRVILAATILGACGAASSGIACANALRKPSADGSPALPVLAGPVTTSITRSGSAHFRALVARLSSCSWRVRRQAQLDLLRERPDRLATVLHRLAPSASPEVRRRLLRIAVHLRFKRKTLLTGRSPLLGIMMRMVHIPTLPTPLRTKGNASHVAVLVLQVQPGFPAAQVLQNGDLITAVNGRGFGPLATVHTFRRLVADFAPGTMLRFTVVRGTRLLRVAAPLAAVPVREGAVMTYMAARIDQGDMLADDLWQLGEKPLIVAARPLGAAADGPAALAPAQRIKNAALAVALTR